MNEEEKKKLLEQVVEKCLENDAALRELSAIYRPIQLEELGQQSVAKETISLTADGYTREESDLIQHNNKPVYRHVRDDMPEIVRDYLHKYHLTHNPFDNGYDLSRVIDFDFMRNRLKMIVTMSEFLNERVEGFGTINKSLDIIHSLLSDLEEYLLVVVGPVCDKRDEDDDEEEDETDDEAKVDEEEVAGEESVDIWEPSLTRFWNVDYFQQFTELKAMAEKARDALYEAMEMAQSWEAAAMDGAYYHYEGWKGVLEDHEDISLFFMADEIPNNPSSYRYNCTVDNTNHKGSDLHLRFYKLADTLEQGWLSLDEFLESYPDYLQMYRLSQRCEERVAPWRKHFQGGVTELSKALAADKSLSSLEQGFQLYREGKRPLSVLFGDLEQLSEEELRRYQRSSLWEDLLVLGAIYQEFEEQQEHTVTSEGGSTVGRLDERLKQRICNAVKKMKEKGFLDKKLDYTWVYLIAQQTYAMPFLMTVPAFLKVLKNGGCTSLPSVSSIKNKAGCVCGTGLENWDFKDTLDSKEKQSRINVARRFLDLMEEEK